MSFRMRATRADVPGSLGWRRRVVSQAAAPIMGTSPIGAASAPDAVTDAQRAAAARIRMSYDKKRGHQTEAWIRNLASRA